MKTSFLFAGLAALASSISTSSALDFGGTLTDHGAYFNTLGYSVTFGDGALKAPGTYSTGVDQLYKNAWYYRPSFSNQARSFGALGDPVSTYTGNVSTATWASNGPSGAFFGAKFKTVLTGYGSNSDKAMFQTTLTITNQQPTNVTHNIYYTLDADVGGWDSLGDDTAEIINGNKSNFRIYDTVNGSFEVVTSGVNRYAMGLAADTWKRMNSVGFVDFANTGSGTVGDVSGILQWTFTLKPGESKTIRLAVGVNTPPIIPCDGDFNRDGFLDFSDFDSFVNAFEEGTATADFNNDGFLDFSDFDGFVIAFEAGC
jgi:hypothetical protein